MARRSAPTVRWPHPVLLRAARRRVLASVLVLATVLIVHQSLTGAERVRAGWGSTTEVVVVTRPVPAGDQVEAAAVAVERRPSATVPDGALRRLGPPARATVDLVPGEVLTPARLDHGARGPVPAALPRGTVGVTVPLGGPVPPAEVGDRVDVVGTDLAGSDLGPAALGSAAGAPGRRVADGAVVLRRGEDSVLLAVPRAQADATAAAALAGPLALVILG